MNHDAIISFQNVSKHFGKVKAVDHASFDIQRGEFFSLLGPSGCGKTTLLRMVAGFEMPSSGEIFLDGEPMSVFPPNRRPVNMVFQNYAIFPHLEVRGNIAFGYLFPDVVDFQDPNFLTRRGDGVVGERLRRGYDFSSAIALDDNPDTMSAFNIALQERDELFNTRVSGYRAWDQAVRLLIPTPRGAARINLTKMVTASGATTTDEAVDVLLGRFLRIPVSSGLRLDLVNLLNAELGDPQLSLAATYMEDPLRMVAHLIMSTPEYQIN